MGHTNPHKTFSSKRSLVSSSWPAPTDQNHTAIFDLGLAEYELLTTVPCTCQHDWQVVVAVWCITGHVRVYLPR